MSIEMMPAADEVADPDVFRIALGVEYKGSNYHGFQLQPEGTPSIQGHLEEALQHINADIPVRISCAGRTDAMVHACGQVIHFDTSIERSMRAWVMGANRYLPKDISAVWAQVMPADFHSRFSAVARRYRYVIYSDDVRPAHLSQEVTWTHQVLDIEKCAVRQSVLLAPIILMPCAQRVARPTRQYVPFIICRLLSLVN